MTETPAFTVDYRGQSVPFFTVDGQGFRYQCPAGCCRAWHWIETASGKRHRVTSAPGEPVTIVASLGCPCKKGSPSACTWHVVITDGIAKDA